jgi:hypothetical protein
MSEPPRSPDEPSTDRTDVDPELDQPEPAGLTPGSDPRPWIGVGVVLAAVFVSTLIMAIAIALLDGAR